MRFDLEDLREQALEAMRDNSFDGYGWAKTCLALIAHIRDLEL